MSLGENPRISISMCPSGWLFAGQLSAVKCQTGHKESWLASVGVRDKAADFRGLHGHVVHGESHYERSVWKGR